MAKLTNIIPVEQPTEAPGFQQVQNEVRDGIADDLAAQFLEVFADRYGVEVDRDLIERSL